MEELLTLFKVEDVSRSAASFDADKLLWVNQEFIRALPAQALLEKSGWYFEQAGIKVLDEQRTLDILSLVQERCKTLLDVVNQSRFFFADIETYDEAAVSKHIKADSTELLQALIEQLEPIESWQAEAIHTAVQSVVDRFEVGFGKVAQPVRIAVTGSTMSPSIDKTLELLGKQSSMSRLQSALHKFSA